MARSVRHNAIVLLNSGSIAYTEAIQFVLPYIDHLGLPCKVIDLATTPLPPEIADYALIVLAHRQIDPHGRRLSSVDRAALWQAVADGAGLVSFDPVLSAQAGKRLHTGLNTLAEELVFTQEPHPITANHRTGERLPLVAPLRLRHRSAAGETVLLWAGASPLLSVSNHGKGRIVTWTTSDWAHTAILGPIAGLDDLFWRGLAWAARKPFVLRGMPPFITMRVDDVTGTGDRWQESPLSWVRAANRFNIKPWLGLFLYNLHDDTVAELRQLLGDGCATAFPHAFGRPARADTIGLHYATDALPLRSSTYDEFIYFDHERGRPWSDHEAARGLAAVDAWYAARPGLPISSYAVGHWYELGSNVAAHIHDVWAADLICKVQDADAALRGNVPWLKLGPFRRHELPGACHSNPARRSGRPVYYADFLNLGGRQFFNCVTEIRDDAGYEWAPDGNITATVGRGIRQLRRALDSMALAVLFTHETDYIYKIAPAAWEQELAQISAAMQPYRPIYVTLDEAVRYVRATRTSQLAACAYDPMSNTLSAHFTGRTDLPTLFYLFTEADTLEWQLVHVPAFTGEVYVTVTV